MENDITEHMLKQESLKKSATMDGLTGNYNRSTTKNYINRFLESEGVDGNHAFVLIDIDHFKLINDRLGHIMGDTVLVEFGHILKNIFHKSDIIGRIGGDEFVVFLKDYGVIELVTAKMKIVLEAFSREHYLADDQSNKIKTTASIGISLYDKDGKNFDELYKAADIAMYESKHQGRDQYIFFSPELLDSDCGTDDIEE